MKYFIYGYYGFGNYGDELLLTTILDKVKQSDGNAKFYVRCKEPIRHLTSDSVDFLDLDSAFYSDANIINKVSTFLSQGFRILDEIDYFIIGGGTLFIDKGEVNKSILLLYLLVKYAKLKNKKVILLGMASDMVANPVTLMLMKSIFKSADFVAARELYLFNYLKYFKIDKAYLTKDLVFCNDSIRALVDLSSNFNSDVKVVGINFIDYFGTLEIDTRKAAEFVESARKLITVLRDKYRLVYLSMQDSIGQRDDSVYASLSCDMEYICLSDIDDIQYFANEIDCVLTMRYHLAVLSGLFQKKCFVINHELKMSSVALDFNYPSMNVYEFMNSNPMEVVDMLMYSKPSCSKDKLDRFYAASMDNFKWLSKA